MAYGTLTFICGPMYSGKTTTLIDHVNRTRNNTELSHMVLKPAMDTRYGIREIKTHDSKSIKAEPISSWDEIGFLGSICDVIFIDEVQFFTKPFFNDDFVKIVQEHLAEGTDIVACGLDLDYYGMPFEISSKLACMADTIIKKQSNCAVCGQAATKTYKLKNRNKVVSVELGSTDLYEPRCNEHWSKD